MGNDRLIAVGAPGREPRSSRLRLHGLAVMSLLLATASGIILSGSAGAISGHPTTGPPTGEFAPFSQCPTANVNAQDCLYGQITAGSVQFDGFDIPITNTITFQAGLEQPDDSGSSAWLPAANGETWSTTEQPYRPSNSSDDCAANLLGLDGDAEATFEMPQNLNSDGTIADTYVNFQNWLEDEGVALEMPLEIVVSNPAYLGVAAGVTGVPAATCTIGPFLLDLTTGTTSPPPPNQPISGQTGTISTSSDGEVLYVDGASLVDNSFAVPAGQIYAGSPAGSNTVVLQTNVQIASAENVVASE
jgi:hypothetical protein